MADLKPEDFEGCTAENRDLYKAAIEEGIAMFKKADRNHDGNMSFDEYKKAARFPAKLSEE